MVESLQNYRIKPPQESPIKHFLKKTAQECEIKHCCKKASLLLNLGSFVYILFRIVDDLCIGDGTNVESASCKLQAARKWDKTLHCCRRAKSYLLLNVGCLVDYSEMWMIHALLTNVADGNLSGRE